MRYSNITDTTLHLTRVRISMNRLKAEFAARDEVEPLTLHFSSFLEWKVHGVKVHSKTKRGPFPSFNKSTSRGRPKFHFVLKNKLKFLYSLHREIVIRVLKEQL